MKKLSMFFCFIALLRTAALLSASENSANNPLGFREYTQTINLTFKNEDDAKRSIITICPLPKDYKLAFSSRWDDTTKAALKTAEIMRKNSCKGTFFHNGAEPFKPNFEQYYKELMVGGMSVGLHTVTHPFLTVQDSHRHFYEYMNNRISLEIITQSSINSQVLPFCNYRTLEGHSQASIGRAMMSAGVIATAEVDFPDFYKNVGYPEHTLAHSRYIAPGDRNSDVDKFKQTLEKFLADKKSIESNPSISMAMHNWHTAEGYINLDTIYKFMSGNPEYWYCNLNEYGAYRFEFFWSGIISQKISGKEVTYTLRRIQPLELGASVPLWFKVTNAQPASAGNAVLHDGLIEVAHDENQKLPAIYARGKIDNVATLKLASSDTDKLTASLENLSDKDLNNVQLTFRLPPANKKLNERKDTGKLAPKGTTQAMVILENHSQDLYYRYGEPYYTVQADFEFGGKVFRLYADMKGKKSDGLPLAIKDTVRYFYPLDGTEDLATLSVAKASLSSLKESQNPEIVSELALDCLKIKVPARVSNQGHDEAAAAVFEFTPNKPGKLSLLQTYGECWINGKKFTGVKNKVEIDPLPGLNRVIIKWEKGTKNLMTYFWINHGAEPSVSYSKP